MGVCGKLFGCSAVLVAVLAVVVGLVMTGAFRTLGVWRAIDNTVFMKGMLPVLHVGVPLGFTMDDVPDGSLAEQNVIVTGANVGLGYWTAHHIASKGANVVLACRSASKCKKAADSIKTAIPSATVETASLDLNSLQSVKDFAQTFLQTHNTLHSLVLNAGIMVPPYSLTIDGIESQIGVNHFAHFLLARELLPILTKTATPDAPTTIVAVSSAASFLSYPEGIKLTLEEMNDESVYDPQDAYGQSKLANILFAQELAGRLEGKNVLVNAIHPGSVDTELTRHIINKVHIVLGSISHSLAQWFVVNLFNPTLEAIAWHPNVASLTQIYTAVGPKLLKEKITGQYFHPIARLHQGPAHSRNMTLQKGLWKLSEEVIAAKEF